MRPARACSGDMYRVVPRMTPGVVAADVHSSASPLSAVTSLATPKSMIFACPSSVITNVGGLHIPVDYSNFVRPRETFSHFDGNSEPLQNRPAGVRGRVR